MSAEALGSDVEPENLLVSARKNSLCLTQTDHGDDACPVCLQLGKCLCFTSFKDGYFSLLKEIKHLRQNQNTSDSPDWLDARCEAACTNHQSMYFHLQDRDQDLAEERREPHEGLNSEDDLKTHHKSRFSDVTSCQLTLVKTLLSFDRVERKSRRVAYFQKTPTKGNESELTTNNSAQLLTMLRSLYLLVRTDFLYMCSELDKGVTLLTRTLTAWNNQKREQEEQSKSRVAALQQLLNATDSDINSK